MVTTMPHMTRPDESHPDRRRQSSWMLRLLFYSYLLIVLTAFLYPVHYMGVDGARVEVGRHFLLTSPVAYEADSRRTMVEIMLAALIFLPLAPLAGRFGPGPR